MAPAVVDGAAGGACCDGSGFGGVGLPGAGRCLRRRRCQRWFRWGSRQGGWTVGLSYTGTSALTFTATVNQPLDGSGLYLELFELTMPGHRGGSSTWGGARRGPRARRARRRPMRRWAARGGAGAHPDEQRTRDYPQAQKVAESDVVSPPPWPLSLAGTTATTNYDVGAAGCTRRFSIWAGRTRAGRRRVTCGSAARGRCAPPARGSGRIWRRWAGLSNWPLPSGLLAARTRCRRLDEQGGATSALENCATCFPADPVNSMTGTLVEPFTDVSVPSRGPGLSWARTYVSSLAGTDGPLGYRLVLGVWVPARGVR